MLGTMHIEMSLYVREKILKISGSHKPLGKRIVITLKNNNNIVPKFVNFCTNVWYNEHVIITRQRDNILFFTSVQNNGAFLKKSSSKLRPAVVLIRTLSPVFFLECSGFFFVHRTIVLWFRWIQFNSRCSDPDCPHVYR